MFKPDPRVLRLLVVTFPPGPLLGCFVRLVAATGGTLHRVVLDGGSWCDTPRANQLPFHGPHTAWPRFLRDLMKSGRFNAVVVFNDCGPRNAPAVQIAQQCGLPVYVLENGYLGPGYVTLERDGVNANSRLRTAALKVDATPDMSPFAPANVAWPDGAHVWRMACHALQTWALQAVVPARLPVTRNKAVALGYLRTLWHTWRQTDGPLLESVRMRKRHKNGFVFGLFLQKPGDTQLVHHSDHKANAPYLRAVMEAFALQGEQNTVLLIKPHPLDTDEEHLDHVCAGLCARWQLHGRVMFLKASRFVPVLNLCDAAITINSSTGLSALAKGLPTLCLGHSLYVRKGLALDGREPTVLHQFVQRPKAFLPDPNTVAAFIQTVQRETQIQASFYKSQHMDDLVPALMAQMAKQQMPDCISPPVQTGYETV